ncbi:uncharacterized protein [Henckelia pumila]|uniref:uncharacterized protein n=1 Tax=Henckelia pumila TaxID=405737 RepID=UPI003C6DEB0A
MAPRFCANLQKSALFLSPIPETKSSKVPYESCSEHFNVKLSICQCLITILIRMHEEYFSLRSSSLYITGILNLKSCRKDDYNWTYDNDDLPDDMMHASAALEGCLRRPSPRLGIRLLEMMWDWF